MSAISPADETIHYELRTPGIRTGHSIMYITNRIVADTLDDAKSKAEAIISRYYGCDYVLIVERSSAGYHPVLVVIGEREYEINPDTGMGRLKFIGYHYDDNPLTCFQLYGYAGRVV